MTYFVARCYSGSDDRNHEETLIALRQHLLPKLEAAGGLILYKTLIMDNGGIITMSHYDNQKSAQKAVQITQAFNVTSDVMHGYVLTDLVEGEVELFIDHGGREPTYGSARIFETRASAAEIAQEISHAKEALSVTGCVRTFIVALHDDRVGVFSSYDSKEALNRVEEQIAQRHQRGDTKMIDMSLSLADHLIGRITYATAA